MAVNILVPSSYEIARSVEELKHICSGVMVNTYISVDV